MKILFISYFFAPYNCIGAVRTTRTVEKLIEMGHDVKVITAKDQHLMSDLSTSVNEADIIRTKWLDFEKPIYSIMGKNRISSIKNINPDSSLKSRFYNLLKIIFHRVISMPDKHIGWYPYAVKESKKLVNSNWIPDIIFASASPYTGLMIAKNLSKSFNIPWIGELRDLWSDNHYRSTWWIDKKFEEVTLKTASALVTVSDHLKEILEKKYSNVPIKTIRNAFDDRDFLFDFKKNDNTEKIKIVHTGAIYAGKRDPSPLFKALINNENLRKYVEIDFYGNDLGYVKYLIEKFQLHDCVNLHDSVSRHKALKYQKEASVLLLLTWDNPMEKGVLTGKLFEYIGSSRPILSIGAIKDDASNLIIENNLGVATNSSNEITNFLESIFNKDFKIDASNRKKFERASQVIKLQEIFYEVIKN